MLRKLNVLGVPRKFDNMVDSCECVFSDVLYFNFKKKMYLFKKISNNNLVPLLQ